MYVGSDNGVYRVPEAGETKRVLASGRVMRLRRFGSVDGLLAATTTGLYRSTDGERWTDLEVPRENTYAVGADRAGRLYVGTRPAETYVSEPIPGTDEPSWRELEGFQEIPSREEWRLPRHEDLAQVRDVHVEPRETGESPRLVAAVEVGGVHVSPDGGETWTERTDGVDDDVHELHVVGAGKYVAATGGGLYRSDDAGRSWTRLDGGVEQRYFRTAYQYGDTVYAGGALSNSSTWNDSDATPAFVAVRDGELEVVSLPVAGTVTGIVAHDGRPYAATHRGYLLRRDDDWTVVGEFPVPGDVTGRYTPLAT